MKLYALSMLIGYRGEVQCPYFYPNAVTLFTKNTIKYKCILYLNVYDLQVDLLFKIIS